MAEWCEVYADQRVLGRARQRARRLVTWFALTSGILVVLAPLSTLYAPSFALWIALGCGVWLSAHGAWLLHRLLPTHRTVWHVELSVRRAVAFDVHGHRHVMHWSHIEHLDLTDQGLSLVGCADGGVQDRIQIHLCVPHDIEGFADLSHRAVEYAEAFGRPIWLDGQPWQALDVSEIYSWPRKTGSSPA